METLKLFAREAKGYRLCSLLSPLMTIIEVAMEVGIPFAMAEMVDEGILEGAGTAFILNKGIKMVCMATVSLLSGAAAARFAAKAGIGFGTNLRNAVFDKILDFSFANIDRFTPASLITRMSADINAVQTAYVMAVRICVRAPLMFALAFYYAYGINSKLAAVFAFAAPTIAIFIAVAGAVAVPRFRKTFVKTEALNETVRENLVGIRVVKAFARAAREKEKFRIANDDLRDAHVAAQKLLVIANPFMQIVIYSCVVAILWFGGRLVVVGTMRAGDLAAFITYVNQILMSLIMISMIFVMAVMSRVSISRVLEVLKEKPDIDDAGADPGLKVENGDIDMENVYFRFGGKTGEYVLSDVNLHVKSGETVGIIGETGSGKTALAQLIPRLYDAAEGEVRIGGRPVADYTLKNLREAVCASFRTDSLFSGTIKENVLWGKPDASDEEIWNACKKAAADDFIASLPNGLETKLGQAGVNLSGGQKQRICIARALVKSPKILILDDSTSAVDAATDAKIMRNLKKKSADTTVIIIAQRINSVKDADKIVVINAGKIDAVGTHAELLASNEIYADVYKTQSEGGVA